MLIEYVAYILDFWALVHFSLNNIIFVYILDTSCKEPASALLWVYHYLAQHYDYLNDIQKALTYIDMAIAHTPTLIELFVTKGRIFKVFYFILY